MQIINGLRQMFKPQEKLNTIESARSEISAIYSLDDFEKYNPDDLIGRKGFNIYRQMMNDEQVKAVSHFKRDAITSRDFYFDLNADRYGITPEEAERRIDLTYKIINEMNGSWTDALNGIMSAMYHGFSMTEKLYGMIEFDSKTWWGIDKLKVRPFDTFYFNVDEFGNITSVKQKLGGKEYDIDITKFIHYVVNPDYDEHYGQSEIKEAHRAWFSKDFIIKFRNMWLERHAGGFRWAQLDGNMVTGSQEHVDLQKVMRTINHSAGVIIPDGVTLNSDYPSNTVAFREAIEDYNTDIARALLVPNLLGVTPSGQTGSYSQSDTQLKAFLWTLKADSDRLVDTLNEQLFKELGVANFGEGWPKFCFKPMSDGQLLEIVKTWKELTEAGAVRPSASDEEHIRELLEFPAAQDGDEPAGVNHNAALTGVQVNALMGIIQQVSSGAMKPETAAQVMVTSFPITLAQAENMLADVEVSQQMPKSDEEPEGEPEDEPEGEEINDDEEQTPAGETIIGAGLISASAFSRALKRVDFAVIGKTSENQVEADTALISRHIPVMVDTMDITPSLDVNKLKFDSKMITKLRKMIQGSMRQAWAMGTRHASIEVDKAKGETFSIDRKRLNFIEEEYFDIKSFAVAGKLTDDALALIKNTILLGVKQDVDTKTIIANIYSALITEGYTTAADVEAVLGAALVSDLEIAKGINVNKAHRIETMTRTNIFEAVNEARYSYFSDPGLDDFVEALEYSAILDSRTTTICQHLDGHVHPVDSDEWNKYRPPNHYNCRSLLVPVTQLDTWSESDPPTADPQKGF